MVRGLWPWQSCDHCHVTSSVSNAATVAWRAAEFDSNNSLTALIGPFKFLAPSFIGRLERTLCQPFRWYEEQTENPADNGYSKVSCWCNNVQRKLICWISYTVNVTSGHISAHWELNPFHSNGPYRSFFFCSCSFFVKKICIYIYFFKHIFLIFIILIFTFCLFIFSFFKKKFRLKKITSFLFIKTETSTLFNKRIFLLLPQHYFITF